MSIIRMTVKQCRDLGLWDNYCEWSGCNPYAVNERQIDNDDEIEFDSEFKKEEKQEELVIIYGQEYCRKDIIYCIIQKVEFEYRYHQYIKYLVSYRNIDGGKDTTFELKDLEQLSFILSLEKY